MNLAPPYLDTHLPHRTRTLGDVLVEESSIDPPGCVPAQIKGQELDFRVALGFSGVYRTVGGGNMAGGDRN